MFIVCLVLSEALWQGDKLCKYFHNKSKHCGKTLFMEKINIGHYSWIRDGLTIICSPGIALLRDYEVVSVSQ